jgi:NAD(P)-dependent dehydrogenase (short-subunit alcohol dehydrogenase family)
VTRRLEDRIVVVTGASAGIGRGIARLFAAEGAHVVVADLTTESPAGGPPTHELVASEGGSAEFVRTDVASEADVEALVAATVERHGRLDAAVNNAATFASKPLLELSREEWDHVFAVNVTGVFLLCRAAVRQMLRQPEGADGVRGRIVNISSQHGMIAAPGDIAYGTTKAAVVYITRQIAHDYVRQGIVCNAVAPGKILRGKPGVDDNEAFLAYARSRTPYPRLGSPEDVARAAVFLASDEATYISGENLMVDGGWTAS